MFTKQDIVGEISKALKIPPDLVSKVITLYGISIISACIRGEKVILRKFGTFEMATHKGRTIKYHEKEFYVPERYVIKFRPGKLLYMSKAHIDACKGKCRIVVTEGVE